MKGKQFLQIILPILLILFAIGFGAYCVVSEPANHQQSGNIASIYLFFLFLTPLLLLLLTILIFIILTYNSSKYLTEIFPKVRDFCKHINFSVNNICSRIAEPIIEVESHLAVFSKDKTEK